MFRLFIICSLSVVFVFLGCDKVTSYRSTSSLVMAMGQVPDSELGGVKWPVTISVDVPHPGWELAVESVYEADQEIFVLARVSLNLTGSDMVAQVITTREQTLMIEGERYPVRVIVVGKTWGWSVPEHYYFFETDTLIDPSFSVAFEPENARQFQIVLE